MKALTTDHLTHRTGKVHPTRSSRPRRRQRLNKALFEALESRTLLSYTVSSLADDGSAGTLRWAIGQANAAGGNQTVTFAPYLTSNGPATITLNGSPLVLADTSGTLTLSGPGANLLAINANKSSQVIAQSNPAASSTVSGLTITGGVGQGLHGGGISNNGTMEIDHSTVRGNTSSAGGGIWNLGVLTVSQSTLTANNSPAGGAIWAKNQVTIVDSTISANTSFFGAGIAVDGQVTVRGSTIYQNSGSMGAGGIQTFSGSLLLQGSIVAANTHGDLAGQNVQFANAYDFIGDGSGGLSVFTSSHNILGTTAKPRDPLLGALNYYGGTTQTLALLPGSPAIDASSNFDSVVTDQRGSAHPSGAAADIGAYEVQTVQAQAQLLPDLPHSQPSSRPALPTGSSIFTPPVSTQAPVTGAPVIAASNTSAGPDQTLSLTGSSFTNDAVADFADTRFLVYGQTNSSNGQLTDAQLADQSTYGIAATIPASEPNNSMYLVWPVNSSGIGTPIAVNQTQAQWMSPQTAAVGQTVTVFGRNLANQLSSPTSTYQSWVYLQSSTGPGQWAPVTSSNPYQVQFTLPAGFSGTTQVWVYNGMGGDYGWSGPLYLTVAPQAAWSGTVNVRNPTVINGVTYAGATGNGTTDDGPAILRAISTLTNYQTLYFPAGTYRINGEQLRLPSNVQVRGDSMTTSTLRFDGAVPAYGSDAFEIGVFDSSTPGVATNTNIDFESIGLIYNGPGTTAGDLVRERDSSRMTFNNVRLISHNLRPIDWQDSNTLTLTNSTIQGIDVVARQTHDDVIKNDYFFQEYHAQAALTLWTGDNIVITNCVTENQFDINGESFGWGEGHFLEIESNWGAVYNLYVANNTTINMGTDGLGDNNTGEQINIETATDSTYHYYVLSATPNSITVFGVAIPEDDLFVTTGPGAGQMQTVSSTTFDSASHTTTFHLNRSLKVAPLFNNAIVLAQSDLNLVFYQNTFNHRTDSYAHFDTASTGFDPYVGGYGLVFDSNHVNQTIAGASLSAFQYIPLEFTDVINNTFYDVQTGVGYYPQTFGSDPDFIGVAVRNNTMTGASTYYSKAGAGLQLSQSAAPGVSTLAIVEHNTVTGFPIGIAIPNDPHVIIYKNSFTLGTAAYSGSIGLWFVTTPWNTTSDAQLQSDSYAGFSSLYTGLAASLLNVNLLGASQLISN